MRASYMVSDTALYRQVKRILDKISWVSHIAAISVLAIVMLATFTDVGMRYLLNRPIRGVAESVELLLILIVFLTFAYVESQDAQVRVTLLISRFRPKVRSYIDCFVNLASVGIFSILVWQTALQTHVVWQQADTDKVLHIPIYPLIGVMTFSFTLLCCQLILRLARSVDDIRRKE